MDQARTTHEQQLSEMRERTTKMLKENRMKIEEEKNSEIEKYRSRLQEIEIQVRSMKRDRDDLNNKNKDIKSELNTAKNTILTSVRTECQRLLQHIRKVSKNATA